MARLLTEVEARELISANKVGHLGCIFENEPYVVPISYIVEDQTIYSHSLPGHKIEALRIHPRACLQVEQIHDDLHWRSAIAFGHFEEIHNYSTREQVLRKLLQRFPMLTPVESQLIQDASPTNVIVFSIRIERVTGVSEG